VISPSDSLIITIDDFRGRPVNRLLYTAEDQGGVLWDGTDVAGAGVPDGPYRLHLAAWKDGEANRIDSWLFLSWDAPSARAEVVATRADDAGCFSVDLADLPLWDSYTVPDPSRDLDSLPMHLHYDSEVYVFAYRGDRSLPHARKGVRIEDGDGHYTVDLRIPD